MIFSVAERGVLWGNVLFLLRFLREGMTGASAIHVEAMPEEARKTPLQAGISLELKGASSIHKPRIDTTTHIKPDNCEEGGLPPRAYL